MQDAQIETLCQTTKKPPAYDNIECKINKVLTNMFMSWKEEMHRELEARLQKFPYSIEHKVVQLQKELAECKSQLENVAKEHGNIRDMQEIKT